MTLLLAGGWAAFTHYPLTTAYLLLQFAAVAWWSHAVRGRAREPRPASDSTWFLPVCFWALESVYGLYAHVAGDGLVRDLLPVGWLMLTLTLACSFATEHLARRAGCATRASSAALPAGPLVAILGIQLIWILGLYLPTI